MLLKPWTLACVLLGGGLLMGCKADSDPPWTAGASRDKHARQPHQPDGSGVSIDEPQACTLLTQALAQTATRLGCQLQLPPCEQYLRTSGAPPCSLFDQGAIQSCVQFYGTLSSCSELMTRPCLLSPIADSAPAGCPPDGSVPEDSSVQSEASTEEAASDAPSVEEEAAAEPPDAGPDAAEPEPSQVQEAGPTEDSSEPPEAEGPDADPADSADEATEPEGRR